MRYWGRVGVVKELDQLLRSSGKATLRRDGREGQHSQLKGMVKPRFFSRQWLVSCNGRTAAVRLVFDYRYRSGEVNVSNEQAWWLASVLPGLADIMAKFKPSSMFGSWEEWRQTLGQGLFGRKR